MPSASRQNDGSGGVMHGAWGPALAVLLPILLGGFFGWRRRSLLQGAKVGGITLLICVGVLVAPFIVIGLLILAGLGQGVRMGLS